MKIKSYILIFLLFKIILTVKSDSCKKDELIVIEEEITNNVQNGSYLKERSISVYDLDSPMRQTSNILNPQINNKLRANPSHFC